MKMESFLCSSGDVVWIGSDILEEDPESTYQEAKAAVKTVPVVNDGAERGVKISSDFLEDARKEIIRISCRWLKTTGTW